MVKNMRQKCGLRGYRDKKGNPIRKPSNTAFLQLIWCRLAGVDNQQEEVFKISTSSYLYILSNVTL